MVSECVIGIWVAQWTHAHILVHAQKGTIKIALAFATPSMDFYGEFELVSGFYAIFFRAIISIGATSW